MFSDTPLVRKVIYGLAIAAQIAAFFIRIYSPELADAFTNTANLLGTLAGVTALTNITPKKALYTLEDFENHLD
jgi:hypothetical protein